MKPSNTNWQPPGPLVTPANSKSLLNTDWLDALNSVFPGEHGEEFSLDIPSHRAHCAWTGSLVSFRVPCQQVAPYAWGGIPVIRQRPCEGPEKPYHKPTYRH